MLNILATLLIFLIVLMIYLHIQYHLKVNNTLEHYSVNEYKKDNINKICQMKQPFSFLYKNQDLLNIINFKNLNKHFKKEYLQIRKKSEDIYLPMSVERSMKLFRKDVSNNYYSENNGVFLKNTDLLKYFKNNSVLSPNLVSNSKYDMILGTKGSNSKLKYNLFYRNFYYVTDGKCVIRLLTPENKRHLNINKNYDIFEYNSNIDCFSDDFNKKYLDVTLSKGDILFIPPYWLYSIKFLENSIITSFHYGSYLSNISIIPDVLKHLVQKQNISLKLK